MLTRKQDKFIREMTTEIRGHQEDLQQHVRENQEALQTLKRVAAKHTALKDQVYRNILDLEQKQTMLQLRLKHLEREHQHLLTQWNVDHSLSVNEPSVKLVFLAHKRDALREACCKTLQDLPRNKRPPLVFVTGRSFYDGREFDAKPVATREERIMEELHFWQDKMDALELFVNSKK